MTNYSRQAKSFTDAIKKLAENPDGLKRLESYLSQHFGEWVDRYAHTPEGLVSELLMFAEIKKED